MTTAPAIVYYEETRALVLTTMAFGAGHLFDPHSGRGDWWHLTWAIKGGDQSLIEKKQAQMDQGDIPIGCLLFVSPIMWATASPHKEAQFGWIGMKLLEHPRGAHIPCEIVRAEWIGGPQEGSYPWRLRVKPPRQPRYADSIRQPARPHPMDTSPAFI